MELGGGMAYWGYSANVLGLDWGGGRRRGKAMGVSLRVGLMGLV